MLAIKQPTEPWLAAAVVMARRPETNPKRKMSASRGDTALGHVPGPNASTPPGHDIAAGSSRKKARTLEAHVSIAENANFECTALVGKVLAAD